MSLHAIILAAGASTRMGRPKALLEYDGSSFFARSLALAQLADQTVVVVGAVAESELRRAGPAAGVRFVQNPNPSDGQFSSIVIGARALPPDAAALLLTVDRPRICPDTVAALRDRWDREREKIHTPRHGGRTGHPILLPASLVDELRGADPARTTLRDFVRSGRWARARLDVDDPGVLENVDTEADYAALSG